MAVTSTVTFIWKADGLATLDVVESIRAKQSLTGLPTTEDVMGKIIHLDKVIECDVFNPHLEGDKQNYTVMMCSGWDEDGLKIDFNTSSKSFIDGMKDMLKEITNPVRSVVIEIASHPSKNFKDRDFYTPRIVDIEVL